MWWAGSSTRNTRLYLSDRSALVCTGDGRRQAARETGWAAVLAGVGAPLDAGRRRGRLQVLLSGGLARPFVQGAVDGIGARDEALQLACATAPEATALDAPCAVWLDRWAPGRACLAAAVEERLLAALRTWASDRGLRLSSVRPWWDLALHAARSRPDPSVRMLTLEDEDALSLLTSSGHGHEPAEVFCYAPPPEPRQRAGTENRIALAAGLDTAEVARARWIVNPLDGSMDDSALGRVAWAEVTGT